MGPGLLELAQELRLELELPMDAVDGPERDRVLPVRPGLLEDLQAGSVDRPELDGHVDRLAEVPGLVGFGLLRQLGRRGHLARFVRLREVRREVDVLVAVERRRRDVPNRSATSRNGSDWTRAFSISARSGWWQIVHRRAMASGSWRWWWRNGAAG